MAVHLQVAGEISSAQLSLVWQEIGTPSVVTPMRPGFGTRLINDVVHHELGGRVDLSQPPTRRAVGNARAAGARGRKADCSGRLSVRRGTVQVKATCSTMCGSSAQKSILPPWHTHHTSRRDGDVGSADTPITAI